MNVAGAQTPRVSPATAMVGLILGLLLGVPAGSAYAVARRGRADRDQARQAVAQFEREARTARRTAAGWVALAVVVVVVFACALGAAGRDHAEPAACAPTSAPPPHRASTPHSASTPRDAATPRGGSPARRSSAPSPRPAARPGAATPDRRTAANGSPRPCRR
ncbi:hypothetical protein GCM10023322_74550 [Rugosimonospora acidiphila]|uniref:Uncharacterized protein n=1 Tax=Rugosimonospora acidiphila TaxID=556531 RepID=A0ABP9SR82_9ACTN